MKNIVKNKNAFLKSYFFQKRGLVFDSPEQDFKKGENRFGWLYEDAKYEKFSACFGSLIGGHSKRHFKDLLDAKRIY